MINWHTPNGKINPKDMDAWQVQECIVYLEKILETGYSWRMKTAIDKALNRFKRIRRRNGLPIEI